MHPPTDAHGAEAGDRPAFGGGAGCHSPSPSWPWWRLWSGPELAFLSCSPAQRESVSFILRCDASAPVLWMLFITLRKVPFIFALQSLCQKRRLDLVQRLSASIGTVLWLSVVAC